MIRPLWYQYRNVLLQTWIWLSRERRRSWLRHRYKIRKVAGSISEEVIEIFIDLFLPTAMALGSNRPLREMSPRGISPGGKGDRCLGLTTLQPSCADCLEILQALTSSSTKGLSRPVMLWMSLLWLLKILLGIS
jgi:hypothetical protein